MLLSVNTGFYSGRPKLAPRYDMIDEAVDYFADSGFEALDVNFAATIYGPPKKVHEPVLDGSEVDWKRNMDRLMEKCLKRNLKIVTSHLPFFQYSTCPEEELNEKQPWVYRSLEAADYIGAEWTVVHMAKTADATLPYVRDLCVYAETRTPYGKIGIAVENTPRAPMEELYRVVDTLRREGHRVGICFDIGHCNYAGLDVCRTIEEIGGDRMKMLHLHDNYGDRDAHKAPYSGNIPWEDAMKALARIGYSGAFNYEINPTVIPECVRKEYGKYCVAVARNLINIFSSERDRLQSKA